MDRYADSRGAAYEPVVSPRVRFWLRAGGFGAASVFVIGMVLGKQGVQQALLAILLVLGALGFAQLWTLARERRAEQAGRGTGRLARTWAPSGAALLAIYLVAPAVGAKVLSILVVLLLVVFPFWVTIQRKKAQSTEPTEGCEGRPENR